MPHMSAPVIGKLCCKDDMDIGLRSEFAFSIGEKHSSTLQNVDIWLDSVLLTYFDNTVYLPSFTNSLENELAYIESGCMDNDYLFLNHGPTTDDMVARATLSGNKIHLSCVLNSGKKVEKELSLGLVISTYKKCMGALAT
jgi:hypothetical protein